MDNIDCIFEEENSDYEIKYMIYDSGFKRHFCYCFICHYKTCIKQAFKRHLTTKKHIYQERPKFTFFENNGKIYKRYFTNNIYDFYDEYIKDKKK